MKLKKICTVPLSKLKDFVLSINPFSEICNNIYDNNVEFDKTVNIYCSYDLNKEHNEVLYSYTSSTNSIKPVYTFETILNSDYRTDEAYIRGLNGELYIIFAELLLGSNGKHYAVFPNYIFTKEGAVVEVRGSARYNLEAILSKNKNYQKVLK